MCIYIYIYICIYIYIYICIHTNNNNAICHTARGQQESDKHGAAKARPRVENR